MTFYALHRPRIDDERVVLLRKAAVRLHIPFRPADPFSFDFSQPSPVKKGDIVYRVSRGKLLRTMENYFLCPGAVTFYKDPISRKEDPFLLMKENIPTPRTIFCSTKNLSQLARYVYELGGFPVVVKALGGTHGMGVMKVDSYQSLVSMVDYLLSHEKLIILRQFIPVKRSARFIVVGNSVVASLEYTAKEYDFRTNEGDHPLVKEKKYSKDLQRLAIRATHACGFEFGGVDILIKNKKPYVTEVNFPCNFVRAERAVRKDIAFEMVHYLAQKASPSPVVGG